MILSISFKMTAEIEIRKHKLMFCVLIRGGVVSALYRKCSFIALNCLEMLLHCFLLSVAWFQLALISSSMEKALCRVPSVVDAWR